jgi:hypothetical protein
MMNPRGINGDQAPYPFSLHSPIFPFVNREQTGGFSFVAVRLDENITESPRLTCGLER